MSRLAAAFRCDVIIQFRNGFYHAAGFVALCWIAILYQLPAARLTIFMPIFVLSNLIINTFYFMAGLVLLEKAEGALVAQSVTPLRNWEYLASKVATLAALSVIENFLIVAIGYGQGVAPAIFALGVVCAAAMFALAGFAVVIRYDSINEFLFPSFLYTLAFVPPFLHYFGIFDSDLIYLHPVQAPLLLTRAAFGPLESWEWIYALLYSPLWIGVGLLYSRHALSRFVTAAEGSMK